jgi:hypothetical protein
MEIAINPNQQFYFGRLSSSIRRSAISHLDDMNQIHQETMEALKMADLARKWKREQILSVSSDPKSISSNQTSVSWTPTKEKNFYQHLNTFSKAEIFLNLQQSIYQTTLLKNKGNLDDKKQMKEIENAETEISRAARIMDILTQEKIRNKKKEG